jgi:hypothetical protein
MLKNQWVVAVVLVALLGATWIRFGSQISAALFPPPPPAIALENFKCLYVGMTIEKAHDILGPASAVEGGRLDMWWSDELSIELHSRDGVVSSGTLDFRNGKKVELQTRVENPLLDWMYVGLSILILSVGVAPTVFLMCRGYRLMRQRQTTCSS